MTLSVNFNVAAMLTHHNLQVVDRSLAQTLQQLSSGLRISRAADDPASMTLANIMRHHLAGLDQATSNSEEGISMIQTAEGAMGELSNILSQARALAINAANAAAHNPDSLAALQAELDAAVASITKIATDTRFGSRALLQGNLADDQLADAAKTSFAAMTQDATKLPGGIKEGSTLTATVAPGGMTLDRSHVQVSLTTDGVTPAATTATLQGLIQNGTALSAVAGKSIVITGPLGSQTVTLAAGATIGDFLAQVNAYTAKTGARAATTPPPARSPSRAPPSATAA
jgi:flagellin